MASSRSSGLFVAPNNSTRSLFDEATPSNCNKNSFFNRREASCSSLLRLDSSASISSIKITLGWMYRAMPNSARTNFSPSPTYIGPLLLVSDRVICCNVITVHIWKPMLRLKLKRSALWWTMLQPWPALSCRCQAVQRTICLIRKLATCHTCYLCTNLLVEREYPWRGRVWAVDKQWLLVVFA